MAERNRACGKIITGCALAVLIASLAFVSYADDEKPKRGLTSQQSHSRPYSTPSLKSRYKEPPKKHFLAWESNNRKEELERYTRPKPGTRRFDLSKQKTVRLETTSFWNSRPYQFSTPLVEGNRLYVGVDAGYFYAIDTEKNDKVWTAKVEGPVASQAVVQDGVVYIGDCKGFMYGIDAASGKINWKTMLDAEILARPQTDAGRLYVVTMSGRLYAIDRATGVEIWHTDSNERTAGFSIRKAAAPVIDSGVIYVGTSSGMLLSYRENDGMLLWVKQVGSRYAQFYDIDSTPVIKDGLMYIQSADGSFACVNLKTGVLEWTSEGGGVNDIAIKDGQIYTSSKGVLSSINGTSGEISWQQDLLEPEMSAPVTGKNFVAVVSTMEKLYLIDSGTGDVAFSRYVSDGAFGDPIVIDDKLYILTNTGKIFSFKVKELPPRKEYTGKKKKKK